MKGIQDSREHSRTRFAREQLLHVKKEERLASLAKTDCEERIRILMEELQGQNSVDILGGPKSPTVI